MGFLTSFRTNKSGVQLLPRVDDGHPHRLKMAHIPGYNRHAMDERRGCNKGIVVRARIRNVEGCATLGHSSINREYATGERWQYMPVHPRA